MDDWNTPVNYQADLTQKVGNLAPLAPVWHSVTENPAATFMNQSTASGHPGVLAGFVSKVANIGKESAHIIGGAAKWLGTQTVNLAKAPERFGANAAHFGMDVFNSHAISSQQTELSQRLDNIMSQYKSGKISAKSYKTLLNEWNQDSNNLLQSVQANQEHLSHDAQQTALSGIDTASTIVTILSGGLTGSLGAGEKAAASFLASHEALTPVETAVGKLAVNKSLTEALPDGIKDAVKGATTDILMNGSADLTAKQIARSVAANVALKYPLAYAALSGTGDQLYNELQNQKYGDAVKTLAFNAALLLSGGPIGWALKRGGQALGAVGSRTFASTTFLEEMSKLTGDGSPQGLFNVIKDDPEAIKNWAAAEATTLKATNGNVTQAVYRILDALDYAGKGDLKELSHEEFNTQLTNWAKAARIADEVGQAKGYGQLAVGRLSVADLNKISTHLSQFNSVDERWQAWEDFKAMNPNEAFSNNQNIDRQIKYLINNVPDSRKLNAEIRDIKAQFDIKGFPAKQAAQLKQLGYIPIKPLNLEAPFKEGGKLTSKFAETNDFFLKATQPLPVLGSIGGLLTSAGLSPESSGQRVYEIFQGNLAENLKGAKLATEVDAADKADFFAKSLGNYARTEKTTKAFGREVTSITDYRQLTLKDIQKALNLSEEDAQKVRGALMDSMIQVPLSVRGLGDRVMDLNYKYNPAAKGYARLQGATRFAWNPFFQAKLSYKAEFLSQAEASGKFPTLAGTNKMLQLIFPEKYAQLDEITQTLERNGIFGAGFAGEAADETVAGYKELGHTLLPSQKRSVAGLVGAMADKAGMPVDEFVANFPNQTRDTVRMILQYDPRSSLLNSPLVRTLNFAFFPFRFNLKVATIMARSLARTDALTQFAVVKGVMNASQFLKSQEGMAWYSQNSDVIGLFKYFSPVATIAELAQALGQKPHSVSQYGELGGLPFGWIPAMLDAEGITHTGQGFVNPTTGVINQDYVPVTVRGRAQAAIEDLLGQLFTYPGSTIGLPSKTSVDVKIAQGLVPGGTSSDFNRVTPPITNEQQQFQKVVQQLNHTSTPPAPPQPRPSTGLSVPPQPTSVTTPTPRPPRSGSARKKKADFTPALLPGQSALGEL